MAGVLWLPFEVLGGRVCTWLATLHYPVVGMADVVCVGWCVVWQLLGMVRTLLGPTCAGWLAWEREVVSWRPGWSMSAHLTPGWTTFYQQHSVWGCSPFRGQAPSV